MAPQKRSARREGRAASGNSWARQRNDQKQSSASTKFQQPLGAVTIYDGRDFRGTVLPQAGRWIAFDEHCHVIGTFDCERQATAAVYEAGRQGWQP